MNPNFPDGLLDMRVKALEGIVTALLALRCLDVAPSDPSGMFAKAKKKIAEAAQTWTVPGIDPAMSDQYAAELADAVALLLGFVESQIEALQKRPGS